MTEPRVDQRARAGTQQAWAGAGVEGQLPIRPHAPTGGGEGAAEAPSRVRDWGRRVLRVVRDLVIGAALTALVPIAFTGVLREQQIRYYGWTGGNTMTKLREVEQMRRYAAPRDPSFNGVEAGRLLAALSVPSRRQQEAFPEMPPIVSVQLPWRSARVPQGLSRRGSAWGGPNPTVVLKLVQRGVTPEDVAYLRTIAEAPVWETFDRVASANTMDILGGRFVLPFRPEARSWTMPYWGYSSARELSYASVSRAAYYLAIGKPDMAEAVLRRTVSFGLVYTDNAVGAFDALIGRTIVGTATGALADLFAATNDPRRQEVLNAMQPVKAPPGSDIRPRNIDEVRERALALATNTSVPRSVRLENLETLSRTVCASTRDVILGPRRDVLDAFSQARRELARSPGEAAWIDLMLRSPNLRAPQSDPPRDMIMRVIVGTSEIASVVWGNPRFSACPRVMTGIY